MSVNATVPKVGLPVTLGGVNDISPVISLMPIPTPKLPEEDVCLLVENAKEPKGSTRILPATRASAVPNSGGSSLTSPRKEPLRATHFRGRVSVASRITRQNPVAEKLCSRVPGGPVNPCGGGLDPSLSKLPKLCPCPIARSVITLAVPGVPSMSSIGESTAPRFVPPLSAGTGNPVETI